MATSSDHNVTETALDAVKCKLSAVNLGYFQDDFLVHFVPKPTRRIPLIHRGYFLRHVAITDCVTRFLAANASESRVQIVSLGAGFDTLFFRLIQQQWTNVQFVEIDSVSLFRIVLVALGVGLQLVVFPLRIAYATIDPPIVRQSRLCGLIVDAVFCLNILVRCNTSAYRTRGQLVTTRRAILRQYRQHGLVLDILACLPLDVMAVHVSWPYAFCLFTQLVVRAVAAYRQRQHFRLMWTFETAASARKWLDWLMYSRVAHLVRIGRLVLRVCLLTHYMACVWTLLNLPFDHEDMVLKNCPAMAIHLHSMYEVFQLLQGQGLETKTIPQDIFGSISVLLGSIALAVMFGHVAILIGNFSANQTAYQRKIESVFAIMEKLQLPQAIRDRVHQYYGYLHTEYESLDGEVVKFARDLSHTLELEVVLYKYMDVVMSVPHWIDCSPDFQKQLVLNVTIRVYLPDDFIIRRGEVGTSCFIINRGICKQYEFTDGNEEVITRARDDSTTAASFVSTGMPKPPSDMKYLVCDCAMESNRSSNEDTEKSLVLTRGYVIGEKALISNYVRSTNVRASTYVEMCVLERDAFQRILTRYPEDREMVLKSIVRECSFQHAAQGTECRMMKMVRRVAPKATFDERVALLVEAMCPRTGDPTIVFGTTDRLQQHLEHLVQQRSASIPSNQSDALAQLGDRIDRLQVQLDRIEQALQSSGHISPALERVVPIDTTTAPTRVKSPYVGTPIRRLRPLRSSRRGSASALEPSSSHTPCADRLFRSHTSTSITTVPP